jgi:hypothetical protein
MNSFVTPLAIMGVITATAVGAATVTAECDYNADGTYTTPEGEIAAHGTFEAAQTCAMGGLLPDIVAQRLGIYGDKATRLNADWLRKKNLEKQQENAQ